MQKGNERCNRDRIERAYQVAAELVEIYTHVSAKAIIDFCAASQVKATYPNLNGILLYPVSHARDLAVYALKAAGVPNDQIRRVSGMQYASLNRAFRLVERARGRNSDIDEALEGMVSTVKAFIRGAQV